MNAKIVSLKIVALKDFALKIVALAEWLGTVISAAATSAKAKGQ